MLRCEQFSHCLLSAPSPVSCVGSHRTNFLTSVVAVISTNTSMVMKYLITPDIRPNSPCKVFSFCAQQHRSNFTEGVIKTPRHRKDLFSSFCSSDWVQPAIIIYDYNCQAGPARAHFYNKMRTVKVVFAVPAQLVLFKWRASWEIGRDHFATSFKWQ